MIFHDMYCLDPSYFENVVTTEGKFVSYMEKKRRDHVTDHSGGPPHDHHQIPANKSEGITLL